MASCRKHNIGYHDDETIQKGKRVRQHALIESNEKASSAATDKSWEGNSVLESIDTETTRTSRGPTHLDRFVRQGVRGTRKDVRFNKLGKPLREAAVDIGYHDDETTKKSKRVRQHALIENKEKATSAAIDKSGEGNTVLESIDTQATRTSRGRTHMDRFARQGFQGIRKDVKFNKLGEPIGEAAADIEYHDDETIKKSRRVRQRALIETKEKTISVVTDKSLEGNTVLESIDTETRTSRRRKHMDRFARQGVQGIRKESIGESAVDIGCRDDEAIQKSKRLRQHAMIESKEKTASAATDKSWEGNTVLEYIDTKTTRTPRGRTHMDRLARQGIQGIRKDVKLNKLGQPIGDTAVEMQSYIGVLARQNVKISYKTWKHVPSVVKEVIWESVNLTYNIDPSWKKGCLNSANNKWRQYKAHLTQMFILSKLDEPEELNEPPSGYDITRDDWSSFVRSRVSDDFIKLSDQQKERRKQNIYPHRLSRKGYAQYAEEIADELCDDDKINRAIIWKKGRVNKIGEFEGDDLKVTVEKIDDFIQQKLEGKLTFEGAKEDILTKALDSEEHAGRVRGIGGHITPTAYFNVGRISKSDAVIKDLIIEHRKELMEAKKFISDQDARIQKLEAIVYKKDECDVEIDDIGGRSVKLHAIAGDEIKTDNSVPSYEDLGDDDVHVMNKADFLQGKLVALTLESSAKIVAYGTIVFVNEADKLLHGVPLPKNCMCVSIDKALDKSAPLPVPIPRESDIIGDAVGTLVAWPLHLIVMQVEPQRIKRSNEKRNPTLSSGVPRSLHMLYCYCKRALDDGSSISLVLDHDVFDDDCELYVHLEDIIPFYHLEPISNSCIVVYIWHLYKKMMKNNKIDKFRFVNPYTIPYVPITKLNKNNKSEQLDQKASVLADRLSGASINQLVLVPCNIGYHWILTVIEPYKEVVYLLDPLGHRNRDKDWKYVVDMALRMFNSIKGRKGRKQALWKVVQAPRQPDAKQCGFYIMRYMRQIIEEVATVEKDSLLSIFRNAEYSQEEIDEVRSEWADCVQDHIYE